MYPFDDLHRYHRPAALIGASFGGSYEKNLDFLQPTPVAHEFPDADLRTLAAFGLKPPRG